MGEKENLVLPHGRKNSQKRNIIYEAIYKVFHSYKSHEGEAEYSLALHMLHQLVFYGLLMTGILLFEVASLNIVSLPTDQQRATFLYEIKYPELWQAQIFREYMHELIFTTPSQRNSSSFDDGTLNLKIQFEAFFIYYSTVLKSIRNFEQLNEESQISLLKNLHYELEVPFKLANESIKQLLYHPPGEPLTSQEYYIVTHGAKMRELTENFGEYSQILNYLVLYEREEALKDPYNPNDKDWLRLSKRFALPVNNLLLPILYSIDLSLITIESQLISFVSSPRLHSIEVNEYEKHLQESLKMISRIQRAKQLNYFCEKAIYQQINDTVEAKLIFDTGKYWMYYLVEHSSLLLWKFHNSSIFHFDHLVAVMLFLAVFWWYNSDRYTHLVNNNNSNGFLNQSSNDRSNFSWSKRTLIPIFIIAINYFISFAILRTLRIASYWSTILPPGNITCKQRKFSNAATWSDPLYDRLLSVFSNTNSLSGGCNDLIFSGHVSLYVLTCIVYHRYCPSVILSGLVYLMALEPSLDAIIKGQHYTVDVTVAIYLTIIIEQFTYRHITPKIVGAELYDLNSKFRALYDKPFWTSLRNELLFLAKFLFWLISSPFQFFSSKR